MLKTWLGALVFTALGLSAFQPMAVADEWDARVDELLANFTTADYVGQMAQAGSYFIVNADYSLNEDAVRQYAKLKVGSYESSPLVAKSYTNDSQTYAWTAQELRDFVTRIQEITIEETGHPMVMGLDSVHGAGLLLDSVKFGQQINGAASFNPDLVYKMGQVAARDTLAAGIPWIFGPILEIAYNPLWPRVYETFGEDPHTISVMADAIVRGIQSENTTAACMKHFIAYSRSQTGHDKEGVTISDFDLLNYFMPPFKAGIDAGALTTMENYISVNGVPTIANSRMMKDLLREDLAFEGMAVSDFDEVDQQIDFHRTARSSEEAVKFTLERSSLDMSMLSYQPTFMNDTSSLLEQYPELLSRVQESARRVVKLKVKLGLYDNAYPGADNVAQVGNDDAVAAALELARESIVLLQNNDTLPLANGTSVFLTGHTADNIGYQCSGWTLTAPGIPTSHNSVHGVSIKDGLENVAGNSSITYFNGLYANGSYSNADLETAKAYAAKSEYTIVAIGEANYEEKTGDINDLALPAGQIEYVKEIAATGTKVVLVLIEGRPRLLGGVTEYVYAVIDGLVPCDLGGQAIAEIIYGQVNPSGRLPITYSKDAGNIAIPYNHRVSTQCSTGDYCEMQWDFGHGLSYTTFDYSDLTLSTYNVTSCSDTIDVSVTVTNSGSVAGKETVMLFLTQPYRSFSVPEVKMLKKFSKISLDAGTSTTVSFTLSKDDWSVYYPQIGQGLKQVAEDTDYVIAIKPETDCDVYNSTAVANPLCATFTLNTGDYPYGALPAVF
jgi:beta-glucosidase